jgi:hypothetical protein
MPVARVPLSTLITIVRFFASGTEDSLGLLQDAKATRASAEARIREIFFILFGNMVSG